MSVQLCRLLLLLSLDHTHISTTWAVPIPTPAYPPGPAFNGNFPLYNSTGYLVYPSNYPAGAYTGLWNAPYFGYGGYGPYGNVRPTFGSNFGNGQYSGYATSAAYGTGTCGNTVPTPPIYNGKQWLYRLWYLWSIWEVQPNFSDAYNPAMGQYFTAFSSSNYLGLPEDMVLEVAQLSTTWKTTCAILSTSPNSQKLSSYSRVWELISVIFKDKSPPLYF